MTDGASALKDLCVVATAAAQKHGHQLDDWIEPGGDSIARRASCRRCGRVAYVRVENGLQGMAGAALREPCRP